MKERVLSERDFLISNVLKAELMLSDYTLATDEQEAEACTELLEQYIENLSNPKATFILNQFTQIADEKSKDLYVEILFDVLAEIKAENDIRLTAWTEHTTAESLIAI